MTPWLSLIGLGEDGALSPAASARLRQAALVVGGARHLKLIGETAAARLAWPSPLQEAFPAILARRGENVCVLASGDPFFFGVGSLLAGLIEPHEFESFPQPSAFSLAASRLGWALQDCALVSLHGRALELIVPHLQPGARVLALAWDGETASQLALLLSARGLGGSQITVLEAMGGARERRRSAPASAFDLREVDPLNTIAMEVAGVVGEKIAPRAPGLPDDWFENDGQLTKREVRALTLSALAPRPRELLWDVGAGSGSIAIEWLLADPTLGAVAVERDPERAARIRRNAASLGVPHLTVVEGTAPAALAGLASPDAIFIGGGLSQNFEPCWAALRPGGRLVANAVTVESQAALSELSRRYGGDLIQAQFARAEPVGRFRGFRPAMPVVQWRTVKS
jgi:precorrin-6B C5,15-methyltransferase / cobalt-precorrin-6B C5,C15-methyltransferase